MRPIRDVSDSSKLVYDRLEALQKEAVGQAFERMAATVSKNQDPADFLSLIRDGKAPDLTKDVLGETDYELKEEQRLAALEKALGHHHREHEKIIWENFRGPLAPKEPSKRPPEFANTIPRLPESDPGYELMSLLQEQEKDQ